MKKRRAPTNLDKTRITRLGGYVIHTVNAFGVRDLTEHDEEFTNFAIHDDFPRLIPRGEIWIDARLFEREGLFYLANTLTHLREKEKGTTEDRAYAAALKVERLLREQLVGVKFRAGRPHKRVPRQVYDQPYVTLPDPSGPIEVWQVHGNLIRSYYRTDYTEGGHGYVYAWVPKTEIWIEHDLDPAEIPFVVAHEYVELRLMRDLAIPYARAHPISSKVEYALREGGGKTSLLLPADRALGRRDLSALAAPGFFESVVKHHVRTRS